MNRNSLKRLAALALAAGSVLGGAAAHAQMMPGGQGGMGGMNRSPGMSPPGDELPPSAAADKPEAAARKAYNAGLKSLNKARDYESAAAAASSADKKAALLEKMNDNYNRALDQFTEALSNKGDMVEAWNDVGFIHWRLGAYPEAIDDYNHTLALKSDLPEAIEHRGEAYLGTDRLEDAEAAYMDLFNHEPPLAEHLMTAMQKWLVDHRGDPQGIRVSDLDAFAKWLQERDGIAKQTASLPH